MEFNLPAAAEPSQPRPIGAHAFTPAAQLEPLSVPVGRAFAIIRRRLLIVLATFVIGVGATAAVLKQMPKQYTSSTALLIEPQRTQVSDLQAISPDPGDVASLVRTQIDILRSPTLALGVVKALDLTDVPEFAPRGGGIRSYVDRALTLAGLHAATPELPPTQASAEQIAGAILAGKVSFANETRSSVLGVSVTTGEPKLSADIANEMARQFLAFKRNEKFAAMQRAHDWFQEQMGTLADQVREADMAAEQYRKAHGLDEQPPDTGNGVRTSSTNRQQLDEISRQLSDVSRERALKEGQLAQAQAVLRGSQPASALPEVLSSANITQLLGQISIVAGREAQLASSQGSGNPELVAVRAQLAKLQGRLQQEMGNVTGSLGAAVQAAQAQERLLRAHLEQLRRSVSDENSAEVGLQALQAKARATRSIYESFLMRATQLANVAGIQEPDATLVSVAQTPLGPSAPKSMRMLAVSALLSLVAGVGVAVGIERMRGGFSAPEELELALGLPMVAVVPRVPRAAGVPKRLDRPDIMLDAALDKLRGQFRALGEQRPSVVMVTSALPQEGKSVFASRLARNAALAGWRVMLVECDFRRPSIAAQFGLPAGPGLSQVLGGGLIGNEVTVLHAPLPHLHVMTAGWTDGDPQELLASRRMEALLATARERYDLIVLDTPPVLPVADALVLSGRADATLMVVRWEKTARGAVQDAVRLLRESRARIMGTVMTRVNMRTAAIVGGRMSHSLDYYDGYHARRTRPQV